VDVDLLRNAFRWLKRDAAPGVDGLTWGEYEQDLESRLVDLHERVHRGAYRALPSRRKFIPKSDGRERPLGVAALEDKIVQRAVVEVLNAIYEEDFLGFSYGFRPGRSPHQALDALAFGIIRTKVSYILDCDIRSFFDSLSHEWLMRFIQHRVGDPRIIRLIRKWLKAGVMVDGNWSATEAGSPQGAVVSPVLANIYLHYCFDLWAEQWRHRHARGHVLYVRFAGETFNFLGFTHICGQSRRGRFLLKRKTCRKRMRAKLKALKGELRRRMHAPIAVQGRWLAQVLRGYFGYFAVPTNYPQVAVAGGAQ
jgi:group II intron reverse transcriptase/maturase